LELDNLKKGHYTCLLEEEREKEAVPTLLGTDPQGLEMKGLFLGNPSS